jgi:hypothetical protein
MTVIEVALFAESLSSKLPATADLLSVFLPI